MTLERSDTNPLDVLLVEDNPADVELTQRILQGSAHPLNVTVAEDGEVAMAVLRREGAHADAPRPDLIILDLNMPKKNGYEVLAEMNQNPDLEMIPVLVLTSTQAERDRLGFINVGPNRYCSKPLPIGRFNNIVGPLRSADYLEWSVLGDLEASERESRMLATYSELAGLSGPQRAHRVSSLVRAECDMFDDRLRAMAVSRLRVELQMDETAAMAIAASYGEQGSELPAELAMRRVTIAQGLRSEFSDGEQERLLAVDPSAFGASHARPQAAQSASQTTAPVARRRRWWWPFSS